MGIEIQPYTRDLVPAVKDFNHRLVSAGCPPDFTFPEREHSAWLPKADHRSLYEELFTAVEGAAVRGAYILKFQNFSFRGRIVPIGYYHSPISEGVVNKAYSTLGVHLLLDALRRQPMLFALGMGGFDKPLPRLLQAMRWKLCAVPFYFKVLHPAPFLRNIQALRTSPLRRLVLDGLAWSGLGWALARAFERAGVSMPAAFAEPVNAFGAWADELWARANGRYAMAAVRDSATLNLLYPRSESKFIKLRVFDGSRVVGWAVALNTQMQGHKQFGNLRLGSIVDCWALPEDAPAVIHSATKILTQCNSDLIISNQSHKSWRPALKSAGFREGPSNFIFAASEKLGELLEPFGQNRGELHLTRGDGDGPIHL